MNGSDSSNESRWSRRATLFAGLGLLLVGALIFRDFLFGNAVLLYGDIGTDSVIGYYTHFVHLSNYIRNHGFPSWSFQVGMGQDPAYATGFLIWHPVTWLPSDLIAPALVFQHLGKVLLAGIFFFRFLQLRDLESPAPLLGSLLLSFSAYMCTGSCWFSLADEVVCFAALLLGTEVALQRGRWLILVLSVALVGMITPFHLYLCAIFLLFYVPIRLLGEYGWHPRIILRTCFRLTAVAVLGVGLGAVVTLPCLYVLLHSPRGSTTHSAMPTLVAQPLFGLASPLHYLTATLKPFGNDLLGTRNDFHGWNNYLEAPLTYCGLLCLLILPQAFIKETRRHRIIYFLCLVAILVPTVFPWFRYLFWLFQGDYYRAYSLFWILGVISLSLMTLSRYVRGASLSLPVLTLTTVALVGTLYLPFEQLQSLINPELRLSVTLFLFLYAVLLTAGQLWKKQKIAAWLIVGFSAIELLRFDQITVSSTKTATRQEITGSLGHKSETAQVLRDIMAKEDEKFFRIRKLQPSGSSLLFTLNDAMAFGYYGTSSYSSFNNIHYTNFLTAVNAISSRSEADTRWSVGLLNDPTLSLFACEKYALVDNPLLLQGLEQYELVKRYEKGYLFRNTRFVPFGLTFDRYITEDAFLKLPASEKPAALLHAVVLSNTSEGGRQGLRQTTLSQLRQDAENFSLADTVATRQKTALKLTSFSETRFRGQVFLNTRSMLTLQTPFDRGWSATQDGRAIPVLKVDVGLLGVGLDPGEHDVELQYRNPFLVPALVVTLTSFLILGVGTLRWPRFGRPA